MLKVYAYKGCDTCRKAVKWLTTQGVAFQEIPIREQPPTEGELRRVLQTRGGDLRLLFNTSGQDYRAGGWKDRLPGLTVDAALEALAAEGNLVKRPVAVDEVGVVAVNGFKEEEWASVFAKS
jgi:arsenate reductase